MTNVQLKLRDGKESNHLNRNDAIKQNVKDLVHKNYTVVHKILNLTCLVELSNEKRDKWR